MSVSTCRICGNSVPTEHTIIISELNNDTICGNCYESYWHGCAVCAHTDECAMKTDNTLPQFVMQTIQMGGAIVQQQVPNPALREKHCPTCICYTNGTCFKELGIHCSNFKIHPVLKGE